MSEVGRTGAARASAILLAAALVRSLSLPTASGPPPLPGRLIVDSLAASADSIAAENDRRNTPLEEGEALDVNTASEVELDRLPGLGPALAGRIVTNRRTEGPFRSADDLVRVPGLGAKSVERIMPHLTFPSGAVGPLLAGTKGELMQRRLLGVMERPASASSLSAAASRSEVVSSTVRLNSATQEQLESLPGIGPVLARRIVEFRDVRGGFEKADELLEVSGLGPTTFARLRGLISVR
ncbi:MAG: ComEA family DNA-binding protein [Longimicrobiales bacterium]